MSSSVNFLPHHFVFPISSSLSPQRHANNSMAFAHSQFVSPMSITRLKKELLLVKPSNKKLRTRHHQSVAVVVAAQSNFLRVLQTVWRTGKDGIEAGTNLVPDSIPRPLARTGVTGAAIYISLFIITSFLSTAFFVVATMGLIYSVYIALNKDEGPRGGGGTSSTDTEETLEEARRIMEKYK